MERLDEFVAVAYQTAEIYHNSWAKSKRGEWSESPQRRADGELHFEHAKRVAAPFKGKPAQEVAGVLHDTFEDTLLTADRLRTIFYAQGFGHTIGSEDFNLIEEVVGLVVELTNVYTKLRYPKLARKERHQREVERLKTISQKAAQIKAVDISDNARSLYKHPSESFRETYKYELLAKKHALPLHSSDTHYQMAADAVSRLAFR